MSPGQTNGACTTKSFASLACKRLLADVWSPTLALCHVFAPRNMFCPKATTTVLLVGLMLAMFNPHLATAQQETAPDAMAAAAVDPAAADLAAPATLDPATAAPATPAMSPVPRLTPGVGTQSLYSSDGWVQRSYTQYGLNASPGGFKSITSPTCPTGKTVAACASASQYWQVTTTSFPAYYPRSTYCTCTFFNAGPYLSSVNLYCLAFCVSP